MALLDSNPGPDDATIKRWMNGKPLPVRNVPRILNAIHEAASTLAGGERPRR